MLKFMESIWEQMKLLERSHFVVNKFSGILVICDCVKLSMKYYNWITEIISLFLDIAQGFENMLCHFNRHKWQHESIHKDCMHVLLVLGQGSWIYLRSNYEIRQIIADVLNQLFFNPIELNIFAQAKQRTCDYAATHINLASLKQKFNNNQTSQTVRIDKKRQIGSGFFQQKYDIILQLSNFSTAPSPSRIPKTSQINSKNLELIFGKEVSH